MVDEDSTRKSRFLLRPCGVQFKVCEIGREARMCADNHDHTKISNKSFNKRTALQEFAGETPEAVLASGLD